MKKLKQYHFWYGAILNAIFECNEDAIPTLLEATEKRGVYKIITNTSKKEYVVFCKHAFQKDNKNKTYSSWIFKFSEEDKKCLKKYYDQGYPVFIYLLCAVDELKESEIAVCTYEEFLVVQDKQTVTIGRKKGKSYFNLHTEKQRATAIHLMRDRIEQKSDTIIDEITYFSPEHYTKQIKHKITINVPENNNNSKKYDRAISGQNIRFLSLSYRDDDICPIHGDKMPPIYVHIGKSKDTAYFCNKCGKYMIPNKRYIRLIKNLGKNSKDIEFEVMTKE